MRADGYIAWSQCPDFSEMVGHIQRREHCCADKQCGDSSCAEHLCNILRVQCRMHLSWDVGADLIEDAVHDITVAVLEAIHEGKLRESARILAYTRTVAQRHVAQHIRENIVARQKHISLHGADISDSGGS